MKKKVFIANWKMNMLRRDAFAFMASLRKGERVDFRIAAPYTCLLDLAESGDGVIIGAQNMSEYSHGAYTGEISCQMIKDAGAKFVLLGHSERRNIMGESNEQIHAKVERAISEAMPCVVCVGERLEDREKGREEEVIQGQLQSALDPSVFTKEQLKDVMVAYEPVWAIGTGKNATLKEIDHMHTFIQETLQEMFGLEDDERVSVLYGGSVKLENIKEICSLKTVDGALVGGASLDVNQVNEMIGKLENLE